MGPSLYSIECKSESDQPLSSPRLVLRSKLVEHWFDLMPWTGVKGRSNRAIHHAHGNPTCSRDRSEQFSLKTPSVHVFEGDGEDTLFVRGCLSSCSAMLATGTNYVRGTTMVIVYT